jgi:hypothetical protein
MRPLVPPDAVRLAERRLLHVRDRMSTRLRSFAVDLRVRLGLRKVRAPGEAEPPRGLAAYYDYRDILEVDQVPAGYAHGAFGLGDAFDLRRGHRGRFALPADVLRRHVAIVGPRRHETRRHLVAPWIANAMELGWSVLAIDADGALDDVVDVEIVESDLGRGGRRRRVDARHPSQSSSWNWMGELDEPAIDAAVRALVGLTYDGAIAGPPLDARILRGALELVRDGAIPPRGSSVASTLRSQDAFSAALRRDRHSDGGARLHELASLRDAVFRSRAAGARKRIRKIERRFAWLIGRPPVRLSELLTDTGQLSLVTRPRDGATGRVLASLLTALLVERAFRQHAGSRRQVLVVVEDARVLLAGVDLAELLEIGSSMGVAFVLCTPTTGAYGRQVAEVLDRCATLITTAGCSPQSARFMSDRIARRGLKLGDREISRPPFPGRIATVDSDLVADRPFLVDISA